MIHISTTVRPAIMLFQSWIWIIMDLHSLCKADKEQQLSTLEAKASLFCWGAKERVVPCLNPSFQKLLHYHYQNFAKCSVSKQNIQLQIINWKTKTCYKYAIPVCLGTIFCILKCNISFFFIRPITKEGIWKIIV